MISSKKLNFNGYIGVAEFEKHLATVIMYPFRNDIWRDNAKYAQETILNIAETISAFEKVILCVDPRVTNTIVVNPNIEIIHLEYDDIWARDISPTFLLGKQDIVGICWGFNAWGGISEGSYHPWDKDAAFAKNLCLKLGIDFYEVPEIILEGGALAVDGNGTMIVSKNVLLNKNRNPSITMATAENYLRSCFNVEMVIWIDCKLPFDETDGHIDNIVRFVKPGEVCLAWSDKKGIYYNECRQIYNNLKNIEDAQGRKYKIHKVKLPPSQHITKIESDGIIKNQNAIERYTGMELPASYLNYYFVNGAVLVPQFDCYQDNIIISQYKKIFHDRRIVPINVREIIIGGGGLHCILKEIPYSPNLSNLF